MNSPGSTDSLKYDPGSQRLTVVFATARTMIFYKVHEDVAALLAGAQAVDAALALHVFGKFEWTEIGAVRLIGAPVPRTDRSAILAPDARHPHTQADRVISPAQRART